MSKTVKYQKLIESGKELFWKHGIKRVSIEEICVHAQVSKMTFYKHFKNKTELVKQILDDTVGKALQDYQELIDADLDFSEKVKRMLEMKLRGSQDISTDFLLDLYKNPELGLFPYIENAKNESISLTLKFLKNAQDKGFIRQEISPDFILYYFNLMVQMTTDKTLLEKYNNPQELIMEATSFFFYGIGASK